MSNGKTLIIDIETAGMRFDDMDELTQKDLTRWIKKNSRSEEEYEAALEERKQEMGLSPLTGEIVAIGVLDADKDQGVVYYQDPSGKEKEEAKGNISYKPMDELSMLKAFWKGAEQYRTFVTFNGRQFDIPFLNLRSAINELRPSKDLMRGRYLYQQAPDAIHIDLADQFNYYGSVRRSGSMHLYCQAFSIESPKGGEVAGEDVTAMFEAGEGKKIALYNAADIAATKSLYEYWDRYLRF
ncbi:MAG: ribonuclease H-like domain-containing protein [Candidatus Harrisonbacteria bacterium]|nr:ribonuclease H-like domain-containing protein [Candidatus Harrisonbacteria bacterium]